MSVQTVSKATATVTAGTIDTVSGSGIETWVGYHIAIVSGLGAGQMRWCPTTPGANQLDVVPDWDIIPDVTSVIHQAKNQADYNSDFGNKFKLLLKATEEWDGGDFFEIGNGVDSVVGGWFGQGISLDDYWLVTANAFFAVGGLFNKTSLGGWYFNSNNSNLTLGYIFLTVNSGGTLLLHNNNFGTVFEHTFDFQVGANIYAYDVSFTKLMYGGSNVLGNMFGNNIKFQGSSANHYINVNTGLNTFDGPLIMSNSNGLVPVGTAQTIIVNKFISVVPLQDMEALGTNIFEFRSPEFGAADGNPIVLWTDNTGNSGWDEKFKLTVSAKAGATPLENARFVIVEGTTVKTLVNRNNTDINGELEDYILKRNARTSAAVTVYLPNLATCYKYGYLPFSATIDATLDVVLPIPFNDDTTLVATEVVALTYAGIVFTKFVTNKHTAIAIDAYTGTIAVGNTVTQTPSGASGIVREIVDNGDNTGYIFMTDRNATAFVDNEVLQVATVTQATADTATFDEDFTWAVNANALSIQNVNDYHMAKLAMDSPVDSWVAELQERFGRVIGKSGDNFFTNNTSSEGAWIYDRGIGTVTHFTADSGIEWNPPITVPISVIVRDETTQTLVDDAMVYIEASAGGPLPTGTVIISPELTGIDGTVSAAITAGNQPFVGLVADATGNAHVAKPISGTIPIAGLTLNVSMVSE